MRPCLLALLVVFACTDRPGIDDTTGTGGDTTAASPTTGDLGNPANACQPVAQDPSMCPADYICCSDDPATAGGRLPNYFNDSSDSQYGPPIFSGANNDLSYSGQCADVGEFPSPFTSGCPVPCNPRWAPGELASICGVGTMCCSFTQVDPAKDCVIDPETDRWRAVRGADIGPLSNWGASHTTNQDPGGESCEAFATVNGSVDPGVLKDCYEQLGVADQRGFCYQSCPCEEDLCAAKNPGYVSRCGG